VQDTNWDLGLSPEAIRGAGAYTYCRSPLLLLQRRIASCSRSVRPFDTRPHSRKVQLPVSMERYGREAHPHFAVVVRGPLTLLHRTSNFMTFHPIFASSFLEAPGEPRPGGQTPSYLRKTVELRCGSRTVIVAAWCAHDRARCFVFTSAYCWPTDVPSSNGSGLCSTTGNPQRQDC
jgi:hypothetical protein